MALLLLDGLDEVVGMPALQSANWHKALVSYWCQIEAGPFWSGDDCKKKFKRAKIVQPYQIARYPVTNADYARFLAANGLDGYDPAQLWWTDAGRTYLLPGSYRFEGEPQQITHPRFWSVARYHGPLQPVVGVTWYEAVAYGRWLTAQGHAQGWLAAHALNLAINMAGVGARRPPPSPAPPALSPPRLSVPAPDLPQAGGAIVRRGRVGEGACG